MSGQGQGSLIFHAPTLLQIDIALVDRLSANHRGREKAITLQVLADEFQISRRDLHDRIANLVVKKGHMIGTTSRKPPGAFWIVDEEDLKVATENLFPRAMKMLVRYSKLKRMSVEEIFHQMRLQLAREDNDR